MAKKEVEEKVARAISKLDEVIKALEAEKADQKVREESSREEAVRKIMDYGISFRHKTLFMVKEKYPNLDFFDISFSNMRGLEEEGCNVQVVTIEGAEESAQEGEPVQEEEA